MPMQHNSDDGASTVRLNLSQKQNVKARMDVLAYRFGGQLANNELYRTEKWASVEPEARRQWKQEHPETAWFEIRHLVHLGWHYARGARKAE